MHRFLKLQAEPLSPDEGIKKWLSESGRPEMVEKNIGAICRFEGIVRNFGENGKMLESLTLEHYPGMTEKTLNELIDRLEAAHPGLEAVLLAHRYGPLLPGETILVAETASRHREQAFQACQNLVDWLKTRAPFWKCEQDVEKKRHWVEQKQEDEKSAGSWEEKGR